MSRNVWIISEHKFFEHSSPETAQAEIARLRASFPNKSFRLYRVKYPVSAGAAVEPPRTVQVGDHTAEKCDVH